MTTLLDADFTAIRLPPEDRPILRADLRTDLQSTLESSLSDITERLTITKTAINKVMQCEGRYVAYDKFEWNAAMCKGTIAHKAIELLIGGMQGPPRVLVNAAFRVLTSQQDSLADFLDVLEEDEHIELQNKVEDMVIKYMEMFPVFPPSWRPNVEAATQAWTGSKQIVFNGKIDLKIGVIDGQRSNTLLLDWKTGSPSYSDMEDLRFYALLETLRTGVAPYGWVNVYLDAGRIEYEEVSEELLFHAVERTVEATRKVAELKSREPVLTPGPICRFCPAADTCSAYEGDC